MDSSSSASTIPEFFYDVLSILMPGLYLLIAIHFIFPTRTNELLSGGVIHPSLTALVLAYLFGFLLYSISSFFPAKQFELLFGQPIHFLLLGKDDSKYFKRHDFFFIGAPSSSIVLSICVKKQLQKLLNDSSFNITDKNVNEVYELCRNYVMENSARRAISIRKEQAYGEMSRAIIVISLFLLGWLLGLYLFGYDIQLLWLQFCVHASFFMTFSFRYAQARIINPYYIYATFSIMKIV